MAMIIRTATMLILIIMITISNSVGRTYLVDVYGVKDFKVVRVSLCLPTIMSESMYLVCAERVLFPGLILVINSMSFLEDEL